jgi:hypothetical protein
MEGRKQENVYFDIWVYTAATINVLVVATTVAIILKLERKSVYTVAVLTGLAFA